MSNLRSCQNCEFFNPAHNYGGYCFRYPTSLWKGKDQWCGEFKPKLINKGEEQPEYVYVNGNRLIIDKDGDIGQ